MNNALSCTIFRCVMIVTSIWKAPSPKEQVAELTNRLEPCDCYI